jgi:hypothetical protein
MALNLAHQTKPEKVREPLDQIAAPLLRPQQVRAMESQVKSLEHQLKAAATGAAYGAPAAPSETRRAMSRVKKQLDEQRPRPYEPHELDDAVKAERVLREQIQRGMPTGMEMRRNPPGAVTKHRQWEKREKANILAWKNIKRRLHVSDALPESGDVDARDVANVEMLRRHSDPHQLAMDNAQIAGRDIYIPAVIEPKNIMSDAEREAANAEVLEIMKSLDKNKAERLKGAMARLMGQDAAA